MPAGVPFVLRVPATAGEFGILRPWWRTAEGALLRTSRVYEREPKDQPFSAPPGSYTLEVVDAAGHKATTSFDLRASDPPIVVELPLSAR